MVGLSWQSTSGEYFLWSGESNLLDGLEVHLGGREEGFSDQENPMSSMGLTVHLVEKHSIIFIVIIE